MGFYIGLVIAVMIAILCIKLSYWIPITISFVVTIMVFSIALAYSPPSGLAYITLLIWPPIFASVTGLAWLLLSKILKKKY